MTTALRNIIVLLFGLMSFCVCAESMTTEPYVLVIDPGHGGKDIGCSGKLENEQSIVLEVSKRLKKIVNENLPDVEVVMTRDKNKYVTLQDRAAIANRANGDVFISIHVNSVDKRNKNRSNIHGASVYTLGTNRSESNLSVAMRENSVMELEDDYTQNYQGFDPKSSESYIIFELNQNTHINKSIELANAIQHELITTAGRADKDVRQAGFWVLWATAMPSVLVELDFICNSESEKFLASDKGKDKMAEAIYNAFEPFYSRHRNEHHGPRVKTNRKQIDVATDNVNKPVAKQGDGTTYHVQILSATKKIDPKDSEIRGVPDIGFFKSGKYYKYYSGSFSSRDEAKNHLKIMKKRFPKAFIIIMRDGKPI